jgi:hypothetical protein
LVLVVLFGRHFAVAAGRIGPALSLINNKISFCSATAARRVFARDINCLVCQLLKISLMAAQAVDFVQPSPAKAGGVSELRRVFSIAAVRNVTVMPRTFYDGPGLLAAIHATAALGTPETMIEWRVFDLEAQPYGNALAPERGRLSVPQSLVWASILTPT